MRDKNTFSWAVKTHSIDICNYLPKNVLPFDSKVSKVCVLIGKNVHLSTSIRVKLICCTSTFHFHQQSMRHHNQQHNKKMYKQEFPFGKLIERKIRFEQSRKNQNRTRRKNRFKIRFFHQNIFSLLLSSLFWILLEKVKHFPEFSLSLSLLLWK